jgi:hypothetical protein
MVEGKCAATRTGASSRGTEFRKLSGADAGDFSAIDTVLLDALRQRDGMDVEFGSTLVLRIAGSPQHDGPRAELGGFRSPSG